MRAEEADGRPARGHVRRTPVAHPEYLIGGVIAGLVTIYLVIALLFPERF